MGAQYTPNMIRTNNGFTLHTNINFNKENEEAKYKRRSSHNSSP